MSDFMNDLLDPEAAAGDSAQTWREAYNASYEQLQRVRKFLPEIPRDESDSLRAMESKVDELGAIYGYENVPQFTLDAIATVKQGEMVTRLKIQELRIIIAEHILGSHLINASFEARDRLPEWRAEAEAMMQLELSE